LGRPGKDVGTYSRWPYTIGAGTLQAPGDVAGTGLCGAARIMIAPSVIASPGADE